MRREESNWFWRRLFGKKDSVVAESFPEHKGQMRICFENWERAKIYDKLNMIEMKLDNLIQKLREQEE